MLRTKVNVNLGVSRDCKDYDVEMQKVMSAVDLGAEAIMDLSSHGNTQPFRKKLVSECPVMIGTVPIYDSVIHYQRDLASLTAKDFLDVIKLHGEDGVDFVTLHCEITRKTIDQIRSHKRKMNIVSRGGSLVFAWMSMTGEENPFYVLGPLVTDIAPGYDHITGAIGGAVAAMNGAAFLCYVTPAEHLALPNVEDVKQGIIASKIAAHAADIAKGIPGARDIDDKMGDARKELAWEAQFDCALDPETARQIRSSRMPEDDHSETCSMCGKFCAVRSMNKALSGEYIDIL